MQSNNRTIQSLATSVAICGIPLAVVLGVLPLPTLGFALPKFVLLTIGATIAASALLFAGVPVLALALRNRVGQMLLMALGIIVLSVLWSVAPLSSVLGVAPRFHGVLTYVCLGTLALCTAWLAGRDVTRNLVWRAVLVSNITVVSYALLQMMGLDPLAQLWATEAFLGRIFSTIGHPNALAQYIVLAVPFLGLAWARSGKRLVQLWWLMLIALNCTVLFATASRSGLLGLVLLVLLSLPTLKAYLRRQRQHIKADQAFALSFIAVLCCSIGLVFFLQRFSSSFEAGRSTAARMQIWEMTLEMFRDRPIGWGLETMAFVSPRFFQKDLYAYESLTVIIDRAHNELLQWLVTVGPLGMLAYAGLVGTTLVLVWRQRHADATGLLRAAGAGILAFQITLLFGFPTIATSLLFWALIGVCIGLLPGNTVTRPRWQERLLRTALWLCCVGAMVVSLQWVQARWVHGHARLLWNTDPATALATYQEGLLTFGYDRESLIETAEAHLILAQQAENPEPLFASVDTIIAMLHTVSGGEDGMEYVLRAWVAALQGDADAAKTALRRAQLYYRHSITYHRAAAHIFSLLEEEAVVHEHESAIRGLLPDAYFEEGSETRRILRKQHPWLENL